MALQRSILLALAVTGAIAGPGSTKQMLDIMSSFATGAPFDAEYFQSLTSCWGKIDPTLHAAQNRMWEGFLNYSAKGGSPDGSDPWYPNNGCHQYGPHQGWFESNYSEIGGALNITVCEPCNFNSNLAFYRSTTRICDHKGWSMSPRMIQAVLRGVSLEAAGSAFMHGSETNLGQSFDTRGEIIVPILAHQMSVEHLPEAFRNNSILRDFSLSPEPTGIELMDLLHQTFTNLPAEHWKPVIDKLPSDLSKPIGAIVGSLLTLVFPPGLVDALIDFIVKVLHNVIDPTAINFLKDKYIPLYRQATAHIKLGPLKRLEIARVGIGGFLKFMYSVIWQEQIISTHKFPILLKPWVNKLGADFMPVVNGLADFMTGFENSDSAVQHCGDAAYPGAGWCRGKIPHAKWHEEAANAYYDLVSLGDYLGALYDTAERGAVPEPENLSISQAAAFEGFLATVAQWVQHQTTVAEIEVKSALWRACAVGLCGLMVVGILVMIGLVSKVRRLQREVDASSRGSDAGTGLLLCEGKYVGQV